MENKLKILANNFRIFNGYNTTEPIDLSGLLQQIAIITVFKPLSEDFSGLSIKMPKENYFMLINSRQSIGRQNFTIGHELYHLFYDDNFTTHKCNTGLFPRKNNSESRADIFASHLLLPMEGIRNMIPKEEFVLDKIRLGTLLKIENTYRCSRAALLNRLSKVNLLTTRCQQEYSSGIIKGALRYGYSPELYEATNITKVIGDYGILANQLYEENKISEGHYRELLNAIGVDLNGIEEHEGD